MSIESVESAESVEACVVQFFGSVHHWRVTKEKEEKEGKRGNAVLRDRSPLFIPLAETRHVTCYCGVMVDQHRPRARPAYTCTDSCSAPAALPPHPCTRYCCGEVEQSRDAVPRGSLLVGHHLSITVSSVIPQTG